LVPAVPGIEEINILTALLNLGGDQRGKEGTDAPLFSSRK
jgi:hypothetical protein